LPVLLDGLIWRSRFTERGMRRVNYYVKYLFLTHSGEFAQAIEWIVDNQDPKIVCHPCVSMVTDIVWNQVAFKSFLMAKGLFVFTLLIFILGASILIHKDDKPEPLNGVGDDDALVLRICILICRCFVYASIMGRGLFLQAKSMLKACSDKDFVKCGPIPVPAYLCSWQNVADLCLTVFLFVMLCLEPILYCLPNEAHPVFSSRCPEGVQVVGAYSVMEALAMLMFYMQLIDISVFSTHVSAFILVCNRVLVEVMQFLFALVFFALAFAAAVSCLEQYDEDFSGIPLSFAQLIKITMGMFRGSHWEKLDKWPLLSLAVFMYVVTTIVFLLNVLIAQLSCAYQTTFEDMLGYARLNRGKIVVNTMQAVPQGRWNAFKASLKLNERVEFGEGDIGLPGGIQVLEPANANITTVDMITRFGGSTSPAAMWPEDTQAQANDDNDRFERMERLMEKAVQRIQAAGGRGRKHATSTNESSNMDHGLSSSAQSGDEETS